MERLWAPWRKKYILTKRFKRCIFCEASDRSRGKKDYVVMRGKYSFSMLNIFPYNNGHIMIAPYRHIKYLYELSDEETVDLISLLKKSQLLLDKVLKPQGYNIGINIGEVSGAGFIDHLHIHIVPRWGGDTNFMPVVSGTKVISESLDSLYERLRKAINKNL